MLSSRCCCQFKSIRNSRNWKNYQAGSGGIVELDKNGMPNGILREQSTKVFDDILPDPLKDIEVQKKDNARCFK